MNDKIEKYDKATRDLILLAGDYELPLYGRFSFPDVAGALREVYKSPAVHRDIFHYDLDKKYDFSTDYCLIGTFYKYLRTGGNLEWRIMRGASHWWSEHLEISGPFDMAHTQFTRPFPYRTAIVEERIFDKNSPFTQNLYSQALMLGRRAGLE